ncbi:hypothetical protein EVAR_94629_1 [Eumeta japonica]|uniref:Uncharacterized protein n=1 Tax=Eumeta variegata TaxID=151549 RepID=A0A4C1UU18_EUMVA|nr:hypothetical protein EVAR_94629_1 [Eumeta japonica]
MMMLSGITSSTLNDNSSTLAELSELQWSDDGERFTSPSSNSSAIRQTRDVAEVGDGRCSSRFVYSVNVSHSDAAMRAAYKICTSVSRLARSSPCGPHGLIP